MDSSCLFRFCLGTHTFKNHCTASLLTVITGFLVLVAASVWGMGMYCLTSVTAEYAASRYLAGYGDFASTIAQRCFEPRLGKAGSPKYKNLEKSLLWKAVDTGGKAGSFYGARFIVGEGGGFLPRPDKNKVYSASAVFDAEGSLLECSWTDFFYFEYLTEGQWKNREERSGNNARTFFDREKLTEAGKELVSGSAPSMHAAAMRFTGTFDGATFIPRKIESIDRNEFQDALHSMGAGSYTVSGITEDHGLQWRSIYEAPDAAASASETVTLYSDWFDVCYDQPSPSFSYKGKEHSGVSSLAAGLGASLVSGIGTEELVFYDGLNLLIPSVNYYLSGNDEAYYTPYYQETADSEESPRLRFYTVSIVYCSPWRTAMGELCPVYLITFLLAAALVLFVRFLIKRYLDEDRSGQQV